MIDLPMWHTDNWPYLEAKHYGPKFKADPWLLVIHSGAIAAHVAEYFRNPGDNRKVSTHLAWSGRERGFMQCVPLSNVAWHCGGSSYLGKGKLNFCSIGIELPGPWNKDRDDVELGKFRIAVEQLMGILPLTHVVRHSDIDKHKKDPGPGFTWLCLDGLGLSLPV